MADSKELQTQLQLNQQINKVLADRSKQMDAMAQKLSGQALLAKELCKAMECQDLDGLEERLGGISGQLQNAADQAGRAGKSLEGAANAPNKDLQRMGDLFGAIGEKINVAKVAGVTFGAKMLKMGKEVIQTLSQMASTAATVAGALYNVGRSVVSIPFKILGGFVKAAASGSGGINELRQAMEKLRGEMGDLSTGEGKAVMDGFDELRSSSSALAKSGLSVGQVFGYGREGAAKMLEAVAEVAKAAGPAFSMLKNQIAGSADVMIMMNKGLGMSNEALAEMARRAHNTGGNVGDDLVEMGSLAIQMGDKFGVSAKTIGKNMNSLIESMEDFGGMSKKQLSATATYMAKLGLEAKDLQGVIGKFDDFESAAEGVSQLNQAFGIQLDTMEMMNAQNPAERIDMMRNAFHAAGKSVEDMTRAEKKLMAEQMGLSVSAMENALAVENQGIAYEDMESAAEDAEANKMSETEVMKSLAKSVEKLVKSGQGVTGFFDAFMKGFDRGFKKNKEYRESIEAIRKSLRLVTKAGVEAGKMIADIVAKFGLFKAIKKFFDPTAMSKLIGITAEGKLTGTGLLGSLAKFKKSVMEGGDYSFGDMIKDMFQQVKDHFLGPGADAAALFEKFFVNMIKAIGDGIASAIPVVVDMFVGLVDSIADFLSNPDSFKNAQKEGQAGIGGALAEAMGKIGPELVKAAPKVAKALGKLFIAAAPHLIKIAVPFLIFAIGKTLLLSALGAVKNAIIAKGTKILTGGIKKMFSGAAKGATKGGGGMLKTLGKLGQKFAPRLSSGIAKGAQVFSKAAGPVAIIAAVAGMGMSISRLQEEQGEKMEEEFGRQAAMMGIGAASVIDAVTLGLLPDSVIDATATFFADISKALLDGLDSLGLNNISDAIGESFASLFEILGAFGDILRGLLTLDGKMIIKGWKNLYDAIFTWLSKLPGLALGVTVDMIKAFATIAGEIVVWLLTDGLKMLIDGVKALFGFLRDVMVEGITEVINFVLDPMPVLEKAAEYGSNLVMGIVNAVKDLPMFFFDLMSDVFGRIAEFWGIASPSKKMMELGGNLLEGLLAPIRALGGLLVDIARGAWNLFTGFFTGLPEMLGEKILAGIKKTFKLGSMLKNAASAAWGKVTSFFSGSPLDAPTSAGGVLGKGIAGGVAAGLENLGPEMIQAAQVALQALAKLMFEGARQIAVGFGQSFVGLTEILVSQLTAVTEVSNKFFGAWAQLALGTIETVIRTFSSGFVGITGMVLEATTKIMQTTIMMRDSFFGFFRDMVDVSKMSMGAVVTIVADTFKNVFKVFTNAREFVLGAFEGIGSTLATFFSKAATAVTGGLGPESTLAQTVTAMVEDVNASLEALGGVSGLDAQVALDNFAQAVGVGTDQVTIKNNGVTVNMSVTVQMDANKVGKVLVDKAQMTVPLATAEG